MLYLSLLFSPVVLGECESLAEGEDWYRQNLRGHIAPTILERLTQNETARLEKQYIGRWTGQAYAGNISPGDGFGQYDEALVAYKSTDPFAVLETYFNGCRQAVGVIPAGLYLRTLHSDIVNSEPSQPASGVVW